MYAIHLHTAAARARAILTKTNRADPDTILSALDSAGLELIERLGTICLPVEDMKHLHTGMTINSSHDSALWYRLRDLITAATSKRTQAKREDNGS